MKRTRCVICQRELKAKRRSDMRFCGGACRIRAHRLRQLNATNPETADPGSALAMGLVGVAAAALVIETMEEQLTPPSARHAQDLAALEQERQTSAALRTQLAEQRAQFDAEIGQKRAEWAAAEEERLRAALRAERVDANKGLGMAYAQIRDLRYERARAVDQKWLAEETLKKLQAEHVEQHRQLNEAKEDIKLLADRQVENACLQLRHRQEIAVLGGAWAETNERCQRLLQAKSDLGERLDNEIKFGDLASAENEELRRQLEQQSEQAKRLAEAEQCTRRHLASATKTYAALQIQYNSLAEQHKGLLTSSGESYETLRVDYNELVGKHNRLLRTGRQRYQDLSLQFQDVVSRYHALMGQHDGRLAEYNALVDYHNRLQMTDQAAYAALQLSYCTLTEQYNRLLAAPAYHQASWADERRQLAAENVRLRSEKYTLAEQLAEASEVVGGLQGTVINQRRQLERVKMEQALLASGGQHKPGRRGRGHALRGKGDGAPRPKAPEGSGSVWAMMTPLFKGAAVGAAGVLAVGKLIASGRSDQARLAPGQKETKRLEGDGGREKPYAVPP